MPPPVGGPGYGPPGGGPPIPSNGPPRVDLNMLPPGIELPRGESALDSITKTLAGIAPGQLQDVMAGMKVSALMPMRLRKCRLTFRH
jgi:cleavage stimulation factor subunit 2